MLPNAGTDSKQHFCSTIHRLASLHCYIDRTHIVDEVKQDPNKLNFIFPLHKKLALIADAITQNKGRRCRQHCSIRNCAKPLETSTRLYGCVPETYIHSQCSDDSKYIASHGKNALKHTNTLAYSMCTSFAQHQLRLSEVPSGLGWLMMPIERQIIWVPLSNKDVNHSSLC